MKEKRRDSKGRILHTGESQRTDGKYLYKYVDAFGNTKYVYAWRLTPTDPTPKGKRDKLSLRELEQQIRRDIEDGIDSTGKKMTLCQLYAKQNTQRANVKKSTQKQREQLMRLLKEDKLGARSIDTIKLSDAKEWALRMKDKGFSYNTINNYKRSLKASFYIAIQDDCVRKNPFDFKLSEVLENDTKEKVALTEEQEQALLSFIKTDNVYHKYYDDVLILLKTGLRISELCGLTVADIDFKNEVVIIDHQLLKSKEQGYYIETPKTKSGIRQVPLSRETIQAFQRVMKKRPKAEPFVIDGQSNFLFVNHKGKPKVAIDYNALFVRMDYVLQTVGILLAVGLIPLSLRLFSLSLVKNVKQRSLPEALKSYRRWSEIRTGMLVVPVLVNLSFYYLTLNNTGVLCAMMALIASLFCVPTRKRMLDELDLVKEENEEPAL